MLIVIKIFKKTKNTRTYSSIVHLTGSRTNLLENLLFLPGARGTILVVTFAGTLKHDLALLVASLNS